MRLFRQSRLLLVVGFVLIGFVLTGCSKKPKTGPEKVRWDRVMCERCIMAVSDHFFSAQVRGGPAEKKTKVYFFDDLGCAVLWLDEQPWHDDPRTEVWVTGHSDGAWLDATKCFYSLGHITPMDFELGAQTSADSGTLNYEQAQQHIRTREQQSH